MSIPGKRPNRGQAANNANVHTEGPETEVAALFDHLVGDRKQRRRINAERPCGLEIDDKFQLDRLVTGKLASLAPLRS
jgi:hypothetical protein